MLKFWADVAPSFGMIGTMIGLVGMLKNMDDLKGIGDSFAIALLTTMWGAIIAYTLCKPWAEKLEGYSARDVQTNQLIVEGALLIKANTNPRLIADRLSSRLAPKARAEMASNNEAANEQAAFLGKPVICFEGFGTQSTMQRFQEQQKLMGKNIILCKKREIPLIVDQVKIHLKDKE